MGLDILKDHYQECLETTQTSILTMYRTRWEAAWQIAIKWARRNLKTLQEPTIDLASQVVTTFMTTQTPSKDKSESQPTQKPEPQTLESPTTKNIPENNQMEEQDKPTKEQTLKI